MSARASVPEAGRGPATPIARGFTAVEALVVLAIITVAALFLLMAVPRAREQARLTTCQRNLSQIGMALALFDQRERLLPTVGEPSPIDPPGASGPPGPLKIVLETLGLPDLLGLAEPGTLPTATGPVPGEVTVPGFYCASDPRATSGLFPAPISYRACTGDGPDSRDGAFAPGRKRSLNSIDAGDGASYTAAFSERLVGDGRTGRPAPWNYALARAPLGPDGCPAGNDASAAWRGDAGSTWTRADYRSTLYNHALLPNASPSCVSADGRAAYMGASSGHVRGVNLLMLDGSVKLVQPSINRQIWREYAAIGSAEAAPESPTRPAP